MPKKRRKAVASFGTPDIPYPKVRVEWIDCVSDSGWANEKEFDKSYYIYLTHFNQFFVFSRKPYPHSL